MNELLDKFIAIEKQIAEERGGLSLFALFLREDAENKWDVVVSAPWFGEDQKTVFEYIVEKIRSRLDPSELLTLSRIILIEPEDESLKAVQRAIHVEHGRIEILDSNFFGLQIKHAYIITSNGTPFVTADT